MNTITLLSSPTLLSILDHKTHLTGMVAIERREKPKGIIWFLQKLEF